MRRKESVQQKGNEPISNIQPLRGCDLGWHLYHGFHPRSLILKSCGLSPPTSFLPGISKRSSIGTEYSFEIQLIIYSPQQFELTTIRHQALE